MYNQQTLHFLHIIGSSLEFILGVLVSHCYKQRTLPQQHARG
uniref:Uncharacterized protein n=1 Tax=Rhizophora mucronata TaxID=61149 RepID=A0A2P2NGT6_RHIMU